MLSFIRPRNILTMFCRVRRRRVRHRSRKYMAEICTKHMKRVDVIEYMESLETWKELGRSTMG